MSQPTCLIQQPNCGRIDGNPVCPKCGIDERVRYVSEEARLLAIANATATYWQAHAKSLEEKPPAAAPPVPPKPTTPDPPKAHVQPPQAGTSKSGLRWLPVVLVLLGGAFAAGHYQSNKQAVLPVEVARAPATAPASNPLHRLPEMVVVPGGNFQMGSNDSDSNSDEKFIRSVNLKSFAIGKYEVTQGQWRAIMGSNPSRFTNCGDNCPVEGVSLDEIQSYIQKLNQKTGQQYRLPSESEWEYACRGGQQQKYCGSNDVGIVAWYEVNSVRITHPVGQKAPNAYGLYDMSGNVQELVQDPYKVSYQGAPTDGSAWETGSSVGVLRGGSWANSARDTRAASRKFAITLLRENHFGFRLARTAL